MLEDIKIHNEKIRQNILKGFNSDLADSIEENSLFNKGEIEYDELEKAVYADTAENRKLGRVGQEYHRGKGKKQEEPGASKLSISEAKRIINSIPRNGSSEERENAINKIISEHKDNLADLALQAESMSESTYSEGYALHLRNIANKLKEHAGNQQPDANKAKTKIKKDIKQYQGWLDAAKKGLAEDEEALKSGKPAAGYTLDTHKKRIERFKKDIDNYTRYIEEAKSKLAEANNQQGKKSTTNNSNKESSDKLEVSKETNEAKANNKQGKKALADELESYYDIENWSDEDDETFVKNISNIIKKYGLTKKDFNAAIKPHRDEIDLSWEDVAPEKQIPANKLIKKQLDDFVYKENYDENESDQSRQKRWATKIAKTIKENNISKEDYNKIHKKYDWLIGKLLKWDDIQKYL